LGEVKTLGRVTTQKAFKGTSPAFFRNEHIEEGFRFADLRT